VIDYTPPDPAWAEKERALVERLRAADERVVLEEEPPGVDELLRQGGWRVDGGGASAVAAQTRKEVGTRVRQGYDIVRVGNFGPHDVAFFHERTSEFTERRRALLEAVLPPLAEVCAVFEYNPSFVTLFYHPGSASRFIQQQLMLNIWPVERHVAEEGGSAGSATVAPFTYAYFYGLLVHKLGHFHDIVHGTRHDFYMNELRIEFLESWVGLLERKAAETNNPAFLPESLMAGPHRAMLVETVN